MNDIIRDSALRLQAIIDTAIDGIITINTDGIVESINKSAASLFQYQPDEVIGKNIHHLMPEPYRSEHDHYLDRYHKTREPRIIGIGREVQGKKKDGSIFPFRLAVSEVVLNDRIIYTGIIHDLSEIKEAEKKLQQINNSLEDKVEERTNQLEKVVNKLLKTNEQLEERESELKTALGKERELNELKSRFVSMASHEFRTPLSTILSSTSLIARYDQSEHQSNRLKHIERIKNAVANLTGILNDFLSLEKLEGNKVELQIREVDLPSLCDEVADDLRGLLKPGQVIDHEISGEPKTLYSDQRIIKNVLFNLLSNAIKYSPENSAVACHMSYQDQFLELSIVDQGIGIPREEQKHLFERFFRATNVETIQGTGLGLNIVKRYVDLIDSVITFESEPGQGSTFTVKIPYQIAK